jgi:hypothetical protein
MMIFNKDKFTIIFNKLLFSVTKIFKRVLGYIFFKYNYPYVRLVNPKALGTYYSQDGQDIFLSSLLFGPITRNLESKWVVDIGCSHPVYFSNSLFFEQFFNCRVLAINKVEEFSLLWKSKRPRAILCAGVLGERASAIELSSQEYSTDISKSLNVENRSNKYSQRNFQKRSINVVRLETIFSSHEISEIFLLLLSLQGFEFDALKGIDFDRVLIRCIVLRNNLYSYYGCDEIRIFLKEKNYEFIARIGHSDDVYVHGSMIRGI